ncbi:MAG: BppU family phage baseplate upper protein [Sarcina sp.]
MSTFKIIADFVNGVTVEEGLIEFIQQDNNTCKLDITLLKNNVAVDMTNRKATFTAETPSGATIEETHLNVVDATTGKVSIVLAADMILEAGKHKAQIQLYPLDSYQRESTIIFSYNVSRSLLTDQKIVSSSRFGTLEEMIITVEGLEAEVHTHEATIEGLKQRTEEAEKLALQSASNSVQSAQAAENGANSVQHAVSSVDGIIEVVEATAREAEKAAAAAKESADSALIAKNAVIQSAGMANSASDNASQAVAQVQNAIAEVEKAKVSATEASTQASNAKQQAESAKQIADQSATTANNAITQANTALNTANQTLNEVNVANNKLDSTMTNANQYKDVATQAATTATNQAKLSEGSATEARLQAEAASRSLTGAEEAKNLSVSAKEEATRQSTLATQKATEATNSATQAGNKLQEVITEGGKQVEAAKVEADRAKVEADRADKTFTIDGQPQQSFNFIENEVVQDGLLKKDIVVKNGNIVFGYNDITSDTLDITTRIIPSTFVASSMNTLLVGGKVGDKYFTVYLGSDGAVYANLGNNLSDGSTDLSVSSKTRHAAVTVNTLNEIRIFVSSVRIDVFVGGKLETLTGESGLLRGSYDNLTFGDNNRPIIGKMLYNVIYNRQLTAQEITHNFNVLNNSPSISGLNEYKLASDSDHVEMDTGRTLQQELDAFRSITAKEFVSAGEDITVNNGIPSKVLSGSIEGQTVKNLVTYKDILNTPTYGYAKEVFVFGEECLELNRANGITPNSSFKPNTQYVFRLLATNKLNPPSAQPLLVRFEYTDGTFSATQNVPDLATQPGTFMETKMLSDPAKTLLGIKMFFITGDNPCYVIKDSVCCIEGSSAIDGLLDTLSSTQASITNNGQTTTYYEPTIQGLTKIVDANGNECAAGTTGARLASLAPIDSSLPKLGGTPSISDTIDRASGKCALNTKERILNGSENWGLVTSSGNFYIYRFSVDANPNTLSGTAIVTINDKVEDITRLDVDTKSKTGITIDYSGNLVFVTDKPTMSEFKAWLQANPTTVRYQLATPEAIQLTPDQLKAYDAHRKVIELAKVGDVADKFEIKEDGSGVFYKNTIDVYVSDKLGDVVDKGTEYIAYRVPSDLSKFSASYISCSHFDFVPTSEVFNTTKQGIWQGASAHVWICIPKSLGLLTAQSIKEYLVSNGVEIKCQLATPTTNTVDKSIMPTIPTDKINILSAGGDVRASKFTASLPVDRISELDARLKALETVIIENTLK